MAIVLFQATPECGLGTKPRAYVWIVSGATEGRMGKRIMGLQKCASNTAVGMVTGCKQGLWGLSWRLIAD